MKVSNIKELYKSGVFCVLENKNKGIKFEIEIHKFGTDELPLLGKYSKLAKENKENAEFNPEMAEMIKKLVALTLRRSLEDATDEDDLSLPLENAMEVFDKILEANNALFENDDKEFLDRIKQRQTTIQNVQHT